MKFRLLSAFVALCGISAFAATYDFDSHFDAQTLRVDISVVGRGEDSHVEIDSIAQWPGWYGRRVNLTTMQYPELLQISLIDTATGDTIFVDTKSPDSIFEEEEGRGDRYHVTMFAPRPKSPAKMEIALYSHDKSGRSKWNAQCIDLDANSLDSLSSRADYIGVPYITLRRAANPDRAVNIAIIAEGYAFDEMDSFIHSAAVLDSALFAEQAFRDKSDRFNVVAVLLSSPQSGITIPSQNHHVNSILASHFDSFGTERLLTIPDTRPMWDALEGVPASVVFVLANSDKYGGSGSYNEYAISSTRIPSFPEIIIHEIGHSFGWLGDEYEADYYVTYAPDVEPMEPNITTLADFSRKWQNLIDSGRAGLFEGAGYQSKGVWRGCEHCLMRSLADHSFCAVCNQALSRTIDYLTSE